MITITELQILAFAEKGMKQKQVYKKVDMSYNAYLKAIKKLKDKKIIETKLNHKNLREHIISKLEVTPAQRAFLKNLLK